MSEELERIKEKYSMEINDISHRLRHLRDGRIKERTGANMDGYLATNIDNLAKEFSDLITKIATGSASDLENLNDIFNIRD